VVIKTWLLPFGAWHLRLHLIESARALRAVEGGFSLPAGMGFEVPPPPLVETEAGSLLARLPWASGGVKAVFSLGAAGARKAELHKPEPNLNLLFPKVLVPLLSGGIEPGLSLLCCAVFAEPGAPRDAEWLDPPAAIYDADTGRVEAGRGGIRVRIETGCRGLSEA
jgi:hypothetical protein